VRVLTWNLFHGRSVPDRPRSLLGEFAAALASWSWDVALLQEVPPWWPPALGEAAAASARTALTSRNLGLPLRRLAAERRPDLVKSNGGGANAILVRGVPIREHRVETLRWWPERRVVHAVRADGLPWLGNVHAQVHAEQRARADLAAAAEAVGRWASGHTPPKAVGRGAAVLGGDFNTREPRVPGFRVAGGHGVDWIAARDLTPATGAEVLDRHRLSDHAPVVVRFE
jgi:endonuclease/exonuclease/phosphatase family metal-dependent hydrolase